MRSILVKEYLPSKNGWEESIFHTANGYLGIRSCPEEGAGDDVFSVRGGYINGFYDIKDISYGEKLYGFPETAQTTVNITDVQGVKLFIGDEEYSLSSGKILKYEHELFMDRGYQEKRILWRSPSGKEVYICMCRMASLVQKHLFILNYKVVPVNFSGEVTIKSSVVGDVENFASADDPRLAGEAQNYLVVDEADFVDDGISLMLSSTKRSKLQLSCAVKHRYSKAFDVEYKKEGNILTTVFTASAKQDKAVFICKYCVFVDFRRNDNPKEKSLEIVKEAFLHPIECFMNKQQKYLEKFWDTSRVIVEGKKLQRSMDYGLYSLLCSVGRDGISSVCAKGLSGEGYEGHYFWDTEIYIFPFFLLTSPEIAKELLMYRYNILPKAREHARIMGHDSGALYAWRSITGSECSAYYPSGSAQYHLTGDVSHAFVQYYLATGDIEFMQKYGAEVLIETARLWMDVSHEKDGVFYIDSVTGPDEYTCIVDNNYYTNCVAKENLYWAYKIMEILSKKDLDKDIIKTLNISDKELKSFKKASDKMYLGYDEKLGITPQDDSFLSKAKIDLSSIPEDKFPLLLNYHPLWLYRHQVCKQADVVLAHSMFEDYTDKKTMEKSFLYYEKITTHDSSLSSCAHSMLASKIGDMKKALSYMESSALIDLEDTHDNTRDGIHTANMGGLYNCIVQGFAGLRIKEEGLYLNPQLPPKWDGYSFSLYFQERLVSVKMTKKHVTLRLLDGEPINLFLFGDKIKLKDKERISL